MNITIVHMKHTGTEVICDLIEMSEDNMAITIKDPHMIVVTERDEKSGTAQMGFSPFLRNCEDDVIHLALSDVLFIAEPLEQLAEQFENMFGPVAKSGLIMPKKKLLMN